MQVIYGLEQFPSLLKNTIVTIGNFDGIHLGHQKILQFLVNKARKQNLSSVVLTFSPHPEKILRKAKLKMIYTLDQRIETIKKYGIQYVLVTPFDKQFSNLSSCDFIQKILVNTLRAKEVIIGENFHFGKNREGDISTIRTLGSRFGLQVHNIPSVMKEGKIVSSSLIRKLLLGGKIEEANRLLGGFFEIRGKVIKGEDRGKSLGFPTANIESENELIPLGIFISEVKINSKTFPSVTNVGFRPTFGQEVMQIESYIINFNRNLYGKEMTIRFIKKIRDEIKFKKFKDLSLQLAKDIEQAKTYFKIKSKYKKPERQRHR